MDVKYFVSEGEDRRLDAQSRESVRGQFVRLSDGVTHYELKGPKGGDVVLLVGGLTVPQTYWDGIVPLLNESGLRTLALSGYGRGLSDRVHAYSEALFVRQLDELVSELGVTSRQHVVGSSMGALVAMSYAKQRRDALSTLTLVGPAGLARATFRKERLLIGDRIARVIAQRFGRRFLEGHLRHNVRDPQHAAELTTMIRAAFRFEGSLHALFDTLQHVRLFARSELYRQTGALGIPTMLLWGADDEVTPIRHFGEARALLRPLEWHTIRECGHMAPLEKPREVADRLASFVQRKKEAIP
jgi:pimeloyl-ACP methyl ester carboxylesterase